LAQIRRSSGTRSMPAPGDRVVVRPLDESTTVIDAVAPRTRLLERRTVGGRSKVLAANVDLLVTVTSLAEPPPRTIVLDQLLAYAHFEEIEPLVVFTKADLTADAATLPALYAALGFTCFTIDAKRAIGTEALTMALRDRPALLCGVSGVGKSSLFRSLGGEGEIGEVSRRGIGRQTTTAARLVRMGSGFLIDSPGIAEFGLGEVSAAELTPAFGEFTAAGRCRFADCSHRNEPDCAVLAAVAVGRIARSRYESYVRILEGSV
ncbi:MAG TPA: ribosome small subunit-dependent GTPase A, partial [Candidatus Dormibacteraeota bacterium]|nr:ribosome small subunit-dependent GTPase A [Candidatus Dormibacteraeota bacterium]